MTPAQVLQEIRRMRFEEAYGGWQAAPRAGVRIAGVHVEAGAARTP